MSFEPTGFSLEIFKDRYAFTENETWSEACLRVSRQMAKAESPEKYEKYLNKFYKELKDNRICPGGRIWYNSGRVNPALLNCFVLDSKLDSKEGWGNLSRNMIITSMSGGGCGCDFSDVRPKGASIGTHRGTSPGAVSLMELINGNGNPVRAGGSRRVALMFSLDLTHPDIKEFLSSKLEKGNLTNANISVRIKQMDKFIDAVKNDKEIELSWKGKYKSSIKAKELWSIICKNAYNSAEPGILNLDLANSENTIYYIEDLVTTNPCGELFLTEFESCCLTSLVLPRFVTEGSLDYAMLGESIRTAVRFLDNVHTVNHYPLPEMKTKAQKLRRIGLGVTGLADMLVLMDFKYGSSESNLFVDRLFEFITKTAYESSILLAIEKGAFEGFNPEKHIQSGFVKRLSNRLKSLILEHGIRNSAIISIPPTGTVSILSGNCSSGIEPMFAPAYYRNYFENDVRKRELVFHPLFKRFIEEGRDVDCFVGGSEISVEQHMEVQKIIQKHVDNAVSKTIIMKQDYSIEDMSKVWLKYLPFLKGVTFYRENSRKFIDKNGLEQEPPLVALTVEEALNLINEEHTEKTLEQKCKSGTCEL